MFSPSLLEYHLLSRHPCCGLLSKRFTYFKVRFRMPYGTRVAPNLFLVYSALSKTYCAMFIRGFRYPLAYYFQLWGVALFQPKVHRAAVFQPETFTILRLLLLRSQFLGKNSSHR